MKKFLAVLMLVAALPLFGLTLPKLSIESYTLDNGLTVYLYQDHSTPIVGINVNYKVGSKNEAPGGHGFAHLFEHMMFQGSKNFDDDYFNALQDVGGYVNGATNQDRTRYLEIVPSNYLERALWLEADRMGFLLDAMTQEKLDNQISVVVNEKRQNYDDAPYGKSYGEMLSILYPSDHPYSWSTIGSQEDLEASTMDDVKDFFRTYYTPSNATLCIAGDFDPAEAKRLVEKYFASLPPGTPVAYTASWVPGFDSLKRRVMKDRVNLARITMVWPTVPLYAANDAELDLLARIFGQGTTSRLYQSVLKEKGLVSDIMAYHSSGQLAGYFAVVATALPGKDLAEIEKAVLEELQILLKDGVTAEELSQAKTVYEASFVRALENVGGFGGISDQITAYDHYLGKPDMFQWDLDRYTAIDLKGIMDASRPYLTAPYGVVEVHPYGNLVAAEDTVDRSIKPEGTRAPKLQIPTPNSFTLSNGLKVLALSHTELPLASVHLILPVGSAADPGAKPGVANLTGEMLMEGTRTKTAKEIQEKLDAIGTNLSIGVDRDATIARMSSLTDNLPESLTILFDVIEDPVFPQKELDILKKQLQSQFLRMQDSMYAMASATLYHNLYTGHPYGNLTMGTPAVLETLTVDDLKAFHDAYYQPGIATLVYVGPHSPEELKSLLQPFVKSWKGKDVKLPKLDPAKAPSGKKIYLVDKPGSAQSMVVVAAPGIDRTDKDYVTATLANHLLGGYFMSRLNMNLREDKGYTYGARSRFATYRVPGPWTAGAPVQGDATVPALNEIFKEIQGFQGAIPVTQEEYDRSKNNMILSLPSQLESSSDLAYQLDDIALYNLPLDTINREYDTLKKVSLKQMLDYAKSFLGSANFQIVVVGDKEKLMDSLKAMNFGDIVLCDRLGNPIN